MLHMHELNINIVAAGALNHDIKLSFFAYFMVQLKEDTVWCW